MANSVRYENRMRRFLILGAAAALLGVLPQCGGQGSQKTPHSAAANRAVQPSSATAPLELTEASLPDEIADTTAPAPSFFTEVLYDDAVQTAWIPTVWQCTGGVVAFDAAHSATVATGTKAVAVHMPCPRGFGAFGFDRRTIDWSSRTWMYPNQYTALSFAINPGSDPAQLAALRVTLDNDSPGRYLKDYLGAVSPHTWYQVTIPMADINVNGLPFFRIMLFNNGGYHPDFLVDDVALHWTLDSVAPQISDVQVSEALQDRVTLAWMTDEFTNYELTYAPAGGLSDSATPPLPIQGEKFSKTQRAQIVGLQPLTTYDFRITVRDPQVDPNTPPNVALHEGSFTTGNVDRTPPAIAGIRLEKVSSTTATVCWETSEPSVGQVQFSQGGVSGPAGSATAYGTAHCVAVEGLQPEQPYSFVVSATDLYGNQLAAVETPVTTTTKLPATLNVFAGQKVAPFTRDILAVNVGNWNVMWNRPYLNESPKLRELTKMIRPGTIRYAGGLASDVVKWDRTNAQCHPTRWVVSADGTSSLCSRHLLDGEDGLDTCGPEPVASPAAYQYAYQADEIDSLAAFARYVEAQVMMEVNVVTCHPEMWADLVRYANVEHNYGFKYWELGNELDLAYSDGVGPIAPGDARIPRGPGYVERYKRYREALRAVDPSIEIVGPGTASHSPSSGYAGYGNYVLPLLADPTVRSEQALDMFSFHYYPWWNSTPNRLTTENIFSYAPATWGGARSHVQACLAEKRALLNSNGFTQTRIGITEFNSMAADRMNNLVFNHAGALYMADMLGRFAYAGADLVANWDLFDTTLTNSYGLINLNDSHLTLNSTTQTTELGDYYYPMPVYYAYLMYAQFFGDEMVTTQSSAQESVTIWASTDSRAPGTMKVLVVNLSPEYYNATVALNGTQILGGKAFVMHNPTFVQTANKNASVDGTGINGQYIDASSTATIAASLQNILNSGVDVAAPSGAGDQLFQELPPYSATALVLQVAAP